MATTQLHPGGFPTAGLWNFTAKPAASPTAVAVTELHPAGIPMAAMWSFTAKQAAVTTADRFVGFHVNVNRMMNRH